MMSATWHPKAAAIGLVLLLLILAALSTGMCLSRPSHSEREAQLTFPDCLPLPKLCVRQAQIPFKQDGLLFTCPLIQQMVVFI